MTEVKTKPRLKNIDGLFGLNAELPTDSEYAIVPFELMDDYPNHKFRLYTGERESDMIESIKVNGIMQPIILRIVDPDSGRYQVLSGHNRKNCGKQAGLTGSPAIIKRGLTDDMAWAYVVETNLLQRGFNELSHSEKAAVIALHHDKMFSQGKRNDIKNELKMLENPHDYREISTSAEIRRSSGTRETLAGEYSLKPNQVALYKRVNELIEPLRIRLDNGEFALSVAASMSFLKEAEQMLVDGCIKLNKYKIDVKKADILRQYSEQGKLDSDNVYLVLSGEAKSKKASSTPIIKLGKKVYTKYFKPEQSAKEVQDIVEQALKMYFEAKE